LCISRRLKPGGGGVNAAIFEAAGSEFEVATKEVAKSLQPGDAVAVPVPAASPLRRVEGVTHVVHVLGPNMNPMRPSSLAGDYKQGCQILRNAYSNLFKVFSSIALKEKNSLNTLRKPLEIKEQSETKDSSRAAPKNAFTYLMQSAKRKGLGDVDLQQRRERPVVEDSKKNDGAVNKESTKTNADVDMVDLSTPPGQQSRYPPLLFCSQKCVLTMTNVVAHFWTCFLFFNTFWKSNHSIHLYEFYLGVMISKRLCLTFGVGRLQVWKIYILEVVFAGKERLWGAPRLRSRKPTKIEQLESGGHGLRNCGILHCIPRNILLLLWKSRRKLLSFLISLQRYQLLLFAAIKPSCLWDCSCSSLLLLTVLLHKR
jgi:hypothetical protein